ncbi:MAG: rhamnulose-1-phosphate aldolase, partial [Prevotella sp.]|nr:rhamnulose-1-phosphate aldolase [Prevotella sp.]
MKSILEGRPELKAVVEQIAEVTGYLWQKGWAERNGGNITVNVTEFMDDECKAMKAIAPVKEIGMVLPQLKGKYFYCKGTGKRMRDLAKEPMQNGSIIRICDDCASYEVIADEPVVPTSELPTHLALQNYLLETGSCYKATLHTHPIELVAMSHIQRFLKGEEMTRVLWSMIPETLAFAPLGIGIVPYALPSSVELAKATLE